jgi:hypothetical protein
MPRIMRTFVLPLGLALGLAVASGGCRDEQAGPRHRPAPTPVAAAGGALLDAVPGDLTFRSEATWAGGAIRYHGSKVEPPNPSPGQAVKLTHYFEATAAPPRGFAFFTHLVDPGSGGMLVNADHEIQGGALPLERWPQGKIVADEHTVSAPSSAARVVLGFWRGEARLPVDQAGAHDGQQRMLGPTVGTSAQEALPEYVAPRVQTPPVIDGDLSDPAWARAQPVTLKGSFDGRTPSVRTSARMVWDDTALYVAFDVEDPDIWGTLRKRDDPIYTEEVVEVFIDANADGRTYNELQVSPHNVVFDAYFPARRQGMDLSWDSQMTSAVKVRGTLDDASDRDEGWTVEMKIPYGPLAAVPNKPPRPGDRWRVNLYRLEHPRRKGVEGQAFSPLFVGDFHHLPRFGWLVFGE